MAEREELCKDVLTKVKEKKIEFIELWFVDLLGFLKCISITAGELEEVLRRGKGFDGSSITGYAEIEESDIIALPDPSTFCELPYVPPDQKSGRMFCDIYYPDGRPYDGDPRLALKKQMERARKMGFVYNVGPEVEFFYFKSPTSPDLLDKGGYFDVVAVETANALRRETVEVLEKMNVKVEAIHHEVSSSQHEFDLKYCDALTIADAIITTRLVTKEIAQKHGFYATFMPKPIYGVNGSGMHVHQSLFSLEQNRNAFYDPTDPYNLSLVAKRFIAGQLKHAREICSLVAQWVNSYKRLVPGYEAPVYVSWAQKNRTTMIRVPAYRPDGGASVRAEYRVPDPALNPYLGFAVMLAAGLEGIEKGYELPPPVEANVYEMPREEREKRGIPDLPVDLFEAINETRRSELVKRTLGEHIFSRFITNKLNEWESYRAQVTSFELEKYLPVL